MAHSRDYIRFARALLLYFAERRFRHEVTGIPFTWQEYNSLIRDVIWHEKRLYGCEAKHRFNTFEQAMQVANRKSSDGHKHRKAYRCDVCGGAHIATLDPGRTRTGKRLKAMRMGKEYDLA